MRRRIVCRGTVQGVGFRPAVYRLATSLGLAGWVCNGPDGAEIEVEGPRPDVNRMLELLPVSLPPLAVLAEEQITTIAVEGARAFEARPSRAGSRRRALVPPDVVICAACRREMNDPQDRRYRYPFTNCTDCGPRFTVVRDLPYDRERTSMSCFPFCTDCRREYTDPTDRRFHAEPVCCPRCGPRLWWAESDGRAVAEGAPALDAARAALAAGQIVAIKGLGGFQLACRADRAASVRCLRERKSRPAKALAVMVRDLEVARRLAVIGELEAALLAGPAAPIVLLPRRPGAPLAQEVAPGLGDVGLMLPTTPLHHELLRGACAALVMTSGNARDEPI